LPLNWEINTQNMKGRIAISTQPWRTG